MLKQNSSVAAGQLGEQDLRIFGFAPLLNKGKEKDEQTEEVDPSLTPSPTRSVLRSTHHRCLIEAMPQIISIKVHIKTVSQEWCAPNINYVSLHHNFKENTFHTGYSLWLLVYTFCAPRCSDPHLHVDPFN